MKTYHFCIIICVFFLALIGCVHAITDPASAAVSGKVYVSNVTYNPGIFFTDDTGTVTIEVTNGNTDQGVVVNHATFSDKNIRLLSGSYDSSSNIGPGKSQTYSFSIVANAMEGTYYPTFSLSFRDADSLFHRAMVQVDNTPVVLTILNKPDSFSQGKKKTVTVQVANSRKNDIKNVLVEVNGPGADVTPVRTFVGNLAPGAKIPIDVAITPNQPTTLVITAQYDNGNNHHATSIDLPVSFGIDKKQADPVISNVLVKSEGGVYHITGDVNNAGLETANSVMVTSLPPAVPQDPYKTYVVGALKPDDFGSFEVTFSAETGTVVTLQLSYKDADGNMYTSMQEVKLSALSGNVTTQNNSSSLFIIIAVVAIVIFFVGAWVFYLNRNKK